MSAFEEDNDRRVIPIWIDSTQALQSPEMQRLRSAPSIIVESEAPQRLAEFNRVPSAETALDLLNTAGREVKDVDVSGAASLILLDENMPAAVRRLAQQVLNHSTPEDRTPNTGVTIRQLRRRLQGATSNPLAWADLARLYISVGESDKSERAMLVAVELAGKNRWITRSASRLFVHLGQPDRALDVISKNPFFRSDPWLMAANVAVSQVAGVAPAFWKEAKKLLTADMRPLHLAELSSAIATHELEAGQSKQAKKLLQQSLIEPTGNVLAQAQWAKRVKHISNLDLSAVDSTEDASEAKYLAAYAAGQMVDALRFAKEWVKDEPYSSRAAIAACYVASLLDDYHSIEQILSFGLRANADNQTLKINRAFCIFASGDTGMFARLKVSPNSVIRDLMNAQKSEDRHTVAHAEATIGLCLYRTGNVSKGKEFYDNAEKIFNNLKISGSALLCLQNHLREAILVKAPWTLELLAKMVKGLAVEAAKASPGAIFYASTLESAVKKPESAENLFKQPVLAGDSNRLDFGRRILDDYNFLNIHPIPSLLIPVGKFPDGENS
nr:hypothetical protein [uncultured Janthinobacterium sp.]